jgi:hypothetical protein
MQKLVCGPRQSGRTTYLAKYIAEKVKEGGGGRITVTSPAFIRTRNLLRMVKSLLEGCDVKDTPSSYTIVFNGWTIYGLLLGDSDKIRATRPDMLVIDDYDECEVPHRDNIIYGYAAISIGTPSTLLASCLSNSPTHYLWATYHEVEELNG